MNRWMKNLFLVLVLMGLCHSMYADKRFSTASVLTMESSKSGGGASFGFTLFEDTVLSIRNEISLHGYGTHAETNPEGIMAVSNKVTLGGPGRGYKSYTFIEGGPGFLILNNSGNSLFWEIKGGGGFEIFASSSSSFFTEIGGGFHATGNTGKGFAHLASGFRFYF